MAKRVLIISPSADDVRILEHALGNAHDGPFDVESAGALEDGVRRVQRGGIDAILVDLTLPDAQGLSCFDRLFEVAPHTPILTLCGLEDEEEAKEAVKRGAQGWLSKGYFDNYLVPQNLRNIIERRKVEQGLYVAQARAEITLNSIGDAVISADMGGARRLPERRGRTDHRVGARTGGRPSHRGHPQHRRQRHRASDHQSRRIRPR